MTEAQFTAQLKKDLAAATGGHVIKHCDRHTGGIPDLSVTVRGVTTWVEVKRDDEVPTPLQRWTLRQLGRAVVVTWRGASIRHGQGELAWRGDDHVGAAMPYTELVLRLRQLCVEERYDDGR